VTQAVFAKAVVIIFFDGLFGVEDELPWLLLGLWYLHGVLLVVFEIVLQYVNTRLILILVVDLYDSAPPFILELLLLGLCSLLICKAFMTHVGVMAVTHFPLIMLIGSFLLWVSLILIHFYRGFLELILKSLEDSLGDVSCLISDNA
jgi:hypothetical protein